MKLVVIMKNGEKVEFAPLPIHSGTIFPSFMPEDNLLGFYEADMTTLETELKLSDVRSVSWEND